MKFKVKAIVSFNDLEENVKRKANESVWECSKERADFLLNHNVIEILEEVKEETLGEKVVDTDEIIVREMPKKRTKKVEK